MKTKVIYRPYFILSKININIYSYLVPLYVVNSNIGSIVVVENDERVGFLIVYEEGLILSSRAIMVIRSSR